MNDNEFKVACALLDAHQKLVAAGKSQRWDVVKWAVAINIGLATASVALRDVPYAGQSLFLFAIAVAGNGWILMWHYNRQLDNARRDAAAIQKYLAANDIDLFAITGRQPEPISRDPTEFIGFTFVIAWSVFPTLIVWMTR